MFLADYGADVVRVDPPGGVPRHTQTAYQAWDRGKRSVVLDLPSPDATTGLDNLLQQADVFVNDLPAALRGLGAGWDDLSDRFPGLIHLALSSDGPAEPERPLDDVLTAARLGLYAGGEEPRHIGWLQPSYAAASVALLGVSAALVAKSRHGGGEVVEVSMQDGLLATWGFGRWWQERTADQPRSDKGQRYRLQRLRLNMCECSDGRYLHFHTGSPGRFWRLMQLLGLDSTISPSKGLLEMGEPLTEAEADTIDTEIPKVLRTRPRDEWLALFEKSDICCEPVLRPDEAFDDAQVLENGLVIEVDDPHVGRVLQLGPPVKMTASPGRVSGPRPLTGQHSSEVRATTKRRPASQPDEATRRLPLLDGVRVLDFGQYVAGPLSGRWLADLGADVIKVEPTAGDAMRPVISNWEFANRGKRSMALDLKSEAGEEVLRRLLPTVDVVLHNMRPAAAERLGIGDKALRELNPSLIYCGFPGWGSTGPKSHHQSFAPAAGAITGLYYDAGGVGNPPRRAGNEDYFNAVLGAIAIMMALVYRQRTGKGQYLESPLLNSATFLMSHTTLGPDGVFRSRMQLDPTQMRYGALDGIYRASDGRALAITLTSDAEFRALATTLGRPEWTHDDRFATAAARAEHDGELSEVLAKIFGSGDVNDLFKRLDDAAVPVEVVAAAPFQDGIFTVDDELARGRVVEFQHPAHGRIREVGRLIRFRNSGYRFRGPGPLLGEHTSVILSELGYSEGEVRRMEAERIAITSKRA
jgi:crotonobetainyl-CoA:carnitine CoA-transferase CaiB-like acyl-CoA transferase